MVFVLSSNYMWSHSINDGSNGGGDSDVPQDSFCRACDKGDSDYDIRQIFNLSAVYQLPLGPGKRSLNSPGILRSLLGGVQVSAIGTVQTGLPVNITIDRLNSAVPGNFAMAGSMRPDYVSGTSLTRAGTSQLDLGLSKFITITERVNFRLRGTPSTFSTVLSMARLMPIWGRLTPRAL